VMGLSSGKTESHVARGDVEGSMAEVGCVSGELRGLEVWREATWGALWFVSFFPKRQERKHIGPMPSPGSAQLQ
jgi:hypothetical protein